jgi:hypothetical protein
MCCQGKILDIIGFPEEGKQHFREQAKLHHNII